MSFVAGRTVNAAALDVPDTDDKGQKVTSDAFWPEIELKNIRLEMRITGGVTTTRLLHAAVEAVNHVNEQLDEFRIEQIKEGWQSLEVVPAGKINGESVHVFRYRRAVYSITRALLIEGYRDIDTTGDGEKHAAALSTQRDDLWRDARWSIADIRGRRRLIAELC